MNSKQSTDGTYKKTQIRVLSPILSTHYVYKELSYFCAAIGEHTLRKVISDEDE